MTNAAPKRKRPRVWDAAQVIARIARRKVVVDAAALPESACKRPMLLVVLDAAENIYPARDGKPPNIGKLYANAELEFERALAQQKLIPRMDGRFDEADVRRLWPGKGRGNAEMPSLPTADVERLARVIRQDGVQGQTLAATFKKAGIKCADKKKQKALIRAAIKHADRHLGTGVPEYVISAADLPALALEELKQPGLSPKAREDSERLAYGEVLTPEEREVFNRQAHHPNLSLMRDEKKLADSLNARHMGKCLSGAGHPIRPH